MKRDFTADTFSHSFIMLEFKIKESFYFVSCHATFEGKIFQYFKDITSSALTWFDLLLLLAVILFCSFLYFLSFWHCGKNTIIHSRKKHITKCIKFTNSFLTWYVIHFTAKLVLCPVNPESSNWTYFNFMF